MRRKQKEITDPAVIAATLAKGSVLSLGLCVDNEPYVVALNYGAEADGRTLYVHCATEGRKLDMLAANNRVSVLIVPEYEVVRADTPCNFTTRFVSVSGHGTATRLTDPEAIRHGLSVILKQHGVSEPEFKPELLARTAVIRIDLAGLTGKQSPAPKPGD